jgi:hypothetical protein
MKTFPDEYAAAAAIIGDVLAKYLPVTGSRDQIHAMALDAAEECGKAGLLVTAQANYRYRCVKCGIAGSHHVRYVPRGSYDAGFIGECLAVTCPACGYTEKRAAKDMDEEPPA